MRPRGKILKRIRIVLVWLVVAFVFGSMATSCGGGGCKQQPERPATPTSPP
jgi:hypothetical protein